MSKPIKQFKTLNLAEDDYNAIRDYCRDNCLTMGSWLGKIAREYMNSNQSPTSFHPTPEQQAIIDSAKYPYSRSVPKGNTDENHTDEQKQELGLQ